MAALRAWEGFYVVVGSSAGALIGLQFVVITLIAEMPAVEGGAEATGAFATPTVAHFAAVLLLAAVLNVPWGGVHAAAAILGLVGLTGVAYAAVVARRMRLQAAYRPQLDDWLFHVLLPLVAYGTLAGSAWLALGHVGAALFGVGAVALLLLFIGIRNAWDAVTHHVFVHQGAKAASGRPPAARAHDRREP